MAEVRQSVRCLGQRERRKRKSLKPGLWTKGPGPSSALAQLWDFGQGLLLTVCLSVCEAKIASSPSPALLTDMSVLWHRGHPALLVPIWAGGLGTAVGPLTHTACPRLLPQAGTGEEGFPLGSTSAAAIQLCVEFLCTGISTNVCSESAPFSPLQQLV